MNEAEKQAIGELEDLLRAFGYSKDCDTADYNYLRDDEPENYKTALAIDTVLNLIEKQQVEIEVYKDIKELAGIEIREILNWKYENKRLKSEIEKKDKIIDEMAKTIYDYASLEVAINCPAEFEGRYNMDLCKMNAKDRNCLICIKEYFKKKVETEEK